MPERWQDGMRWITNEMGIRFLLRRKTAAAVAILTMALAFGANTAVFSVLRTFLMASVGVPDPDHLVVVGPLRELPGRGAVLFFDAYPNYELARNSGFFENVATTVQGTANWDDHGEARPVEFARTTASFFATMKVFPFLGRTFEQKEEGPSPALVVLISNKLWQSAFGGDSGALGRTMLINGAPHTIIGIMPPGFAQPAPTDVWLPFDIPASQRVAITGARQLSVFGRLAPEVDRARAATIAAELTRRALAASKENKDFHYELQPLRTVLLNTAGSAVMLVQIGAVVLLALAVLNLASLLVAWGFDRQSEMAVRQALGAGSRRLVRLMILQSVFVVSVGATMGIILARLALPWIRSLQINPQLTYFTQRVELDSSVLGISVLVAMIAGIVAGVLPAWFTRKLQLSESLRSGSRTVTLSRAALRWQQGMVLVQAAMSVVVLAAAALIVVSFRNASAIPSGFTPGKLVVARVQLPITAPHGQRAAFIAALEENLRREPAISAFGATSTLPVSDVASGARFFLEPGAEASGAEPFLLHFRRVTPGYIGAMHIPLLRGRNFDAHDDSAGRPVIIVSKALADRAWPGADPIGKLLYRVTPAQTEAVEVVGIVGNVMDAGNRSPPGEAAYLPWARVSYRAASFVLEPRTSTAETIAAFKHALRATDPLMAASGVEKLQTLVDQSDAVPRLQSLLLIVFAVVAMGITALGSYGVMSQLVANREREYALRLVFGASQTELARSVLVLMARLAIPGIALGLGAILALGGLLQAFVFGVDPRSAAVLTTVCAGMACVTMAATLPSMVRAMRVDVRSTVGP